MKHTDPFRHRGRWSVDDNVIIKILLINHGYNGIKNKNTSYRFRHNLVFEDLLSPDQTE